MPSTKITPRKQPNIPAVPSVSYEERIATAYERLGVRKEDVDTLPKITHILKALPGDMDEESGRVIPETSGIHKAIMYLRGSSEPDARKWLNVYDQIPPSYRNHVPFEAYCLASNLTTKRVLELVTGACFEQSDNTASLIARAAKPRIVQATVESAMLLGHEGAQDRRMMHLHEGFVPVPKTSVVNVHGNVMQDNRTQAISIGELGRLDSDMAKLEDKFNQRFGVTDGNGDKGEVKVIEGEVSAPAEPAESDDWEL